MLGLSHNLTKTVCMYNNNYNVQWTLFNLIYKTLSENWLHQSATLSQKKWKQGMIQIRDLSEWAPCNKIIFSYLAVSNWPNSVPFFLLTKSSWDRSKERREGFLSKIRGAFRCSVSLCVNCAYCVNCVTVCQLNRHLQASFDRCCPQRYWYRAFLFIIASDDTRCHCLSIRLSFIVLFPF